MSPNNWFHQKKFKSVIKFFTDQIRQPSKLTTKTLLAIRIIVRSGPRALANELRYRILRDPSSSPSGVGAKNNLPGAASHSVFSIDSQSSDMSQRFEPLISIITSVYNVDGMLFEKAVASVQRQSYANWEICICDDASTNSDTISALAKFAKLQPQIRIWRSSESSGISNATNNALSIAVGEFVAFLGGTDELAPNALETFVAHINLDPSIDILYSDEDKLNSSDECTEPFLKPDWSPWLLREGMYVGDLLMARRSLLEKVGGANPSFDGLQDYELLLRLSEQTKNIRHVPAVLYHSRRISGNVASDLDAKRQLSELQAAAVNEHLSRMNIQAIAHPNSNLARRVIIKPKPRSAFPPVSIVVQSKDAPDHVSRCLDSIFKKTSYPNFEVIVVDNEPTDQATIDALKRYQVSVVYLNGKFNFSRAINIGVANVTGDILILLDNNIEVISGDWIEQLLFLIEASSPAVVGPLLLYPNNTVENAGLAIGLRGGTDHVSRGLGSEVDGYFGSVSCIREVSGVAFSCVMIRKSDFIKCGGLNELFNSYYQDIDFCLRFREAGGTILYTPRTRLVNHESKNWRSHFDGLDHALLLDRWRNDIEQGELYSRSE